MFSDDLEDKIAQIMRGNFSPAKSAPVTPKPAKSIPNNTSNISIAMLSDTSSDTAVSDGIRSTDATPIRQAVSMSPKSIPIKVNTNNNTMDKTSAPHGISNANLSESSSAVNSTSSSFSNLGNTWGNTSNSSIQETIPELVPSNDIAAMILKLQNSSRDSSPMLGRSASNSISGSGRSSPAALPAESPKRGSSSGKSITGGSSKNSANAVGIASSGVPFTNDYSSPLVSDSPAASPYTNQQSDEVNDLLFGVEESTPVADKSTFNRQVQSKSDNTEVNDSEDEGVTEEEVHIVKSSSLSPPRIAANDNARAITSSSVRSGAFRNFERSPIEQSYLVSNAVNEVAAATAAATEPGESSASLVDTESDSDNYQIEAVSPQPAVTQYVKPVGGSIVKPSNIVRSISPKPATSPISIQSNRGAGASASNMIEPASPIAKGRTLPTPNVTPVSIQSVSAVKKVVEPAVKMDISPTPPIVIKKSVLATPKPPAEKLAMQEQLSMSPYVLPSQKRNVSPAISARIEALSAPKKTNIAPDNSSPPPATKSAAAPLKSRFASPSLTRVDSTPALTQEPAVLESKPVPKIRTYVTSPSPRQMAAARVAQQSIATPVKSLPLSAAAPPSERLLKPTKSFTSSVSATPQKDRGTFSDVSFSAAMSKSGANDTFSQQGSPNKQSHAERPVKVAVRVRPFTIDELDRKSRRTIAKSGEKLIIVNPKAFDAEPDTIAAAAVAMDNKQWAQIFQFNNILWGSDESDFAPQTAADYMDQEDVYESVGRDIVDHVLQGVSASCFAYGHTGTGKTHTLFGNIVGNHSHTRHSSRTTTPMKGSHSSHAHQQSLSVAAASTLTSQSGLIPRVMHDIVSGVNNRDIFGNDTCMFFSFVEIYNEKIRDLLTDSVSSNQNSNDAVETLKAREHPVFGPYVEGLNKIEVSSPEEVLRLIARGQSNRSTSSTIWNSTSSRSHAIVTLELSPSNYDKNIRFISPSAKNNEMFHKTMSAATGSANDSLTGRRDGVDPHQHLFVRVQMVDLAGSEKDTSLTSGSNSGSGCDDHGIWKGSRYNDTTPNKQAEAVADKEKNELKLIRRSLSTLGYIIKALAKGVAFKSLPYRDSVLTFLLRDALNGHNHTTMLATISPADHCYEETLSTLRYAEKLCSLRGHNTISGGNALNHSISYGSPVTSLVAADRGMQHSQKVLLEEFTKIHDGLGHNRPGSNANRQLLHQTIADPQQRIAKMTKVVYDTDFLQGVAEGGDSEWKEEEEDNSDNHNSLLPVDSSSVKKPTAGVGKRRVIDTKAKSSLTVPNGEVDNLKHSYRALQAQLVELQIDIESVKADRDSVTVELRQAREQLSNTEHNKMESKNSIASLTKSFKAAEKEIGEYRQLLRKKEENIERLVAEISTEKQGRLDAEHAYHSRTKDFLARFEAMKKENKALSLNLDTVNQKYKAHFDDKKDQQSQVEKLKAHIKLLTAARDTLSANVDNITNENNTLKLRLQQLTGSTSIVDYEKANSELALLVSRLQSDVSNMTSERDALSAMITQKDSLLKIQSQQADMSIKMLQQRQAALERSDSQPSPISPEDYTKLQDSLRELFAKEGQVLHAELLDTKNLTAMIRDLREKMTQYDSLLAMYERERQNNIALQQQNTVAKERGAHQDQQKIDLTLQNDLLHAQVAELRSKADGLEQQLLQAQLASAAFQNQSRQSSHAQQQSMDLQSLASSSTHYNHYSSMVNSSTTERNHELEVQLRAENNLLREQLLLAQNEVNLIRNDSLSSSSSREALQKEIAALWNTNQELSKADAAKEKTIRELSAERDKALVDCNLAMEQLRKLTIECNELRQEIKEMDTDLLSAVENAGGGYPLGQQQGNHLILHKVPDRMMLGIARRRQLAQRSQPQSSPVVMPATVHNAVHSSESVASQHSHFSGNTNSQYPPYNQSFNPNMSPPVGIMNNGMQQYLPPPQPQFVPQSFQQQQQFINIPSQYPANKAPSSIGGIGNIAMSYNSHSQQQQHQLQHQHQLGAGHSAHLQQPLQQQHLHQTNISSQHSVSSSSHGQNRNIGRSTQLQQQPQQRAFDDDKEYELSEKILQRQIEELSDFLDDEAKLKRSRLQRQSNGSLSSLAQSNLNSAKKVKQYTPTTKLNFEF